MQQHAYARPIPGYKTAEDEWPDDSIPEWHKEELDRRLGKIESGEAVLISWEEVKQNLLKK